MQNLRLPCNRRLESPQQVRLSCGAWKIQARDFDFVAPFALVPRGQHPGIILLGADDLVAGSQIDAHLRNLKRLTRVARDGNLLRICAKFGGKPPPRSFDIFFDQRTVIRGRLIGPIHVSLARFVNDCGGGTLIAVIEIDERAIQRKGELNLTPVCLVSRDVLGFAPGNSRCCGSYFLNSRRPQRKRGCASDYSQKRTPTPHDGTS